MQVMRVGDVFKPKDQLHLRGFFWRQKDMPLHQQEFFEIVFILNGEAMHCTPERMEKISRGDVLIIPAGGRHGYFNTENLLIFNLLFVLEDLSLPQLDLLKHPGFRHLFLRQVEYFDHQGQYPHLHFAEADIADLESLLRRLAHTPESSAATRLGYLLVLIGMICERWESQCDSDRLFFQNIVKAVNFCHTHYAEAIYLEDLARVAAMSKNSLLRNFRKVMLCSPMAYLLRLRLAKACQRLLNSPDRVNEVATACGFADVTYFSRIFKANLGVSPQKFRGRGGSNDKNTPRRTNLPLTKPEPRGIFRENKLKGVFRL